MEGRGPYTSRVWWDDKDVHVFPMSQWGMPLKGASWRPSWRRGSWERAFWVQRGWRGREMAGESSVGSLHGSFGNTLSSDRGPHRITPPRKMQQLGLSHTEGLVPTLQL